MKSKPTVLIAEDEDHIRVLLKNLLESLGTSVVGEADDGTQAVSLYADLRPNITLLDFNMPQKSGVQALKEIIAFDEQALVIMVSSIGDADSVLTCLDLGAAHFLLKDTPLPEMKRIIVETWKDHTQNHAA